MTHPFKGAGVALVTPFHTDNSIDFNALERLVEDQIASGTDYLVALGTTAETPALSQEEQRDIVQCVRSVNGSRVPLIVGMGGNNTSGIVEKIKRTDFEGVDAILSVTPYYNKPSQEGLFEHFRLVADASPVPVVLYNVPSRTGVNMAAETSVRIAQACPNVVALKEACGDTSQVTRIVRQGPEHFEVISGDDALALPVIAVGGIGVISVAANALPEQISRMVRLAYDDRFAEAREIHLQLADMLSLLFREGSPAGIKALLEIMGKAANIVRLPLCPVSRDLYRDIETELKRICVCS